MVALPVTFMAQSQETSNPIMATLPNGQPLPAWIRYDAKLNALVIDAVINAVFPLTVVLTVGGQSTLIQVLEAKDS